MNWPTAFGYAALFLAGVALFMVMMAGIVQLISLLFRWSTVAGFVVLGVLVLTGCAAFIRKAEDL